MSTGYGMDDCGNNLVVCEPTRFKVIERLREKELIDGPPLPPEDCGKVEGSEDDECPERRCFYVVACYAESPVVPTPFQARCRTRRPPRACRHACVRRCRSTS